MPSNIRHYWRQALTAQQVNQVFASRRKYALGAISAESAEAIPGMTAVI
jgi:hypothetical protein